MILHTTGSRLAFTLVALVVVGCDVSLTSRSFSCDVIQDCLRGFGCFPTATGKTCQAINDKTPCTSDAECSAAERCAPVDGLFDNYCAPDSNVFTDAASDTPPDEVTGIECLEGRCAAGEACIDEACYATTTGCAEPILRMDIPCDEGEPVQVTLINTGGELINCEVDVFEIPTLISVEAAGRSSGVTSFIREGSRLSSYDGALECQCPDSKTPQSLGFNVINEAPASCCGSGCADGERCLNGTCEPQTTSQCQFTDHTANEGRLIVSAEGCEGTTITTTVRNHRSGECHVSFGPVEDASITIDTGGANVYGGATATLNHEGGAPHVIHLPPRELLTSTDFGPATRTGLTAAAIPVDPARVAAHNPGAPTGTSMSVVLGGEPGVAVIETGETTFRISKSVHTMDVTGHCSGGPSIYASSGPDGQSVLISEAPQPSDLEPFSHVLFDDFDGDGHADLLGVVTGEFPATAGRIYTQSISTDFTQDPWGSARVIALPSAELSDVVSMDVDQDGLVDMITAMNGAIVVLINEGGLEFSHAVRDDPFEGGMIFLPIRLAVLHRRDGSVSFFALDEDGGVTRWTGSGISADWRLSPEGSGAVDLIVREDPGDPLGTVIYRLFEDGDIAVSVVDDSGALAGGASAVFPNTIDDNAIAVDFLIMDMTGDLQEDIYVVLQDSEDFVLEGMP